MPPKLSARMPTTRRCCKGHDPPAHHRQLQKWKGLTSRRFAPSTDSLWRFISHSFYHRCITQFSNWLPTFVNLHLLYTGCGRSTREKSYFPLQSPKVLGRWIYTLFPGYSLNSSCLIFLRRTLPGCVLLPPTSFTPPRFAHFLEFHARGSPNLGWPKTRSALTA